MEIANTDYYEFESAAVGGRFGVWVTRPVGYDANRAEPYPAVYVLDGNMTAPMCGPYVEWFGYDVIDTFTPFVTVAIGYTGADARDWLTLRARDLVPADEPVNESVLAGLQQHPAFADWTQEERDQYLERIRGGYADRFLAFCESELAPYIEQRYRVGGGRTGLWGYSYGGLFALYALFRQSGTFSSIGAGSPGLNTPDSQIFRLLRECADGADINPVSLHLTLHASEITGKDRGLRGLAMQFTRLVDGLYRGDIKGLDFTAKILTGETHATGWTQSFMSFVRSHYSG
jgi:uncharacterized protein